MSLLTDLASPLHAPNGPAVPKPGAASPPGELLAVAPPVQRRDLPPWIARRPQGWLSLPFVLAMTVPLVALDLWISLYQAIGFPLLGIPAVRRRDHFAMDRTRLPYLDAVAKAHWYCCGYASAVLSFAREITVRTEQYWCPVRHGRLAAAVRDRYFALFEYPEGAHHETHAHVLRIRLTTGEAGDADRASSPGRSSG